MGGRTLLAWNLRTLRTERGLSQERLAYDAGIARHSVSQLELEKRNPTLDNLDRLAAALHVELHQLLLPRPGDAPDPQTLRAGRKPN